MEAWQPTATTACEGQENTSNKQCILFHRFALSSILDIFFLDVAAQLYDAVYVVQTKHVVFLQRLSMKCR